MVLSGGQLLTKVNCQLPRRSRPVNTFAPPSKDVLPGSQKHGTMRAYSAYVILFNLMCQSRSRRSLTVDSNQFRGTVKAWLPIGTGWAWQAWQPCGAEATDLGGFCDTTATPVRPPKQRATVGVSMIIKGRAEAASARAGSGISKEELAQREDGGVSILKGKGVLSEGGTCAAGQGPTSCRHQRRSRRGCAAVAALRTCSSVVLSRSNIAER